MLCSLTTTLVESSTKDSLQVVSLTSVSLWGRGSHRRIWTFWTFYGRKNGHLGVNGNAVVLHVLTCSSNLLCLLHSPAIHHSPFNHLVLYSLTTISFSMSSSL